jgi:precorrin-3B synthase
MMSGDGLVVRVRPMLARLKTDQAMGLCDLAERHGSGLIDLTNRANLQLRGVRGSDHEALLKGLFDLGLLPDDPELEARRNILVAPDWQHEDDTYLIATELTKRLSELPSLPAKFGFVVDAGPAPVLNDASGDIRVERAAEGLIVRADGMPLGCPTPADAVVDLLIEMAHWFARSGGAHAKRMRRLIQSEIFPKEWQQLPALPARATPNAGQQDQGTYYGTPFGQMHARDLRGLLDTSGCPALRVTPWRLFLTEDAAPVATDAFITKANDPLLRIDACTGAAGCDAGEIDTRALALALAGQTEGSLHISGCAKGCARPRNADLTLVGRSGKVDLVRDGKPWDDPFLTAVSPDDLKDRIGEF